MQRAGVTGFKLLTALQTGDPLIGADIAATELRVRTVAAKATPATTFTMLSSLIGAPYGRILVGLVHICLLGSCCTG